MLLRWNRILKVNVNQKTFQLRESIEKLEKANDELKTHDRLQKEFINIAAHELRTPTQAISGNLELIEMMYIPSVMQNTSSNELSLTREFEVLVNDKQKLADFIKGLESTYRNSQRLEKLVNDILDTSRIESNRLEIHKEYFNLNEKINNVIKDISKQTGENSHSSNAGKEVNIRFNPSIDPLVVYADKIRIFEVISNLLNNAIKFSEGNPIFITAEKSNGNGDYNNQNDQNIDNEKYMLPKPYKSVIVSIKDQGKGIDRAILPRLFTKFATKSSQGTGLGLYIAKNIIEAHGGQIWASNNNDGGGGTTFSFTLPV